MNAVFHASKRNVTPGCKVVFQQFFRGPLLQWVPSVVVSTHLKNISHIGSFPQVTVKRKKYSKPPQRSLFVFFGVVLLYWTEPPSNSKSHCSSVYSSGFARLMSPVIPSINIISKHRWMKQPSFKQSQFSKVMWSNKKIHQKRKHHYNLERPLMGPHSPTPLPLRHGFPQEIFSGLVKGLL